MKIEVSEQDIAAGTPCSEEACPVALALYRVIAGGYEVLDGGIVKLNPVGCAIYVNADSILIIGPDEEHEFTLPYVVSNLIYDYDSGKGMDPFGFMIAD